MDGKIRPLYIQHSAIQLTYHRRSKLHMDPPHTGPSTFRDQVELIFFVNRLERYNAESTYFLRLTRD